MKSGGKHTWHAAGKKNSGAQNSLAKQGSRRFLTAAFFMHTAVFSKPDGPFSCQMSDAAITIIYS
jgi:hypothetical protein